MLRVFRIAFFYKLRYLCIAFVCYYAFRVVIKILFADFNVGFYMLPDFFVKLQFFEDLIVAFKQLYAVKSLLSFRNFIACGLFNVCKRFFNGFVKFQRMGKRSAGSFQRGFYRFVDARVLQSGNTDDPAAELF